jgi:C1A family cysteine protease
MDTKKRFYGWKKGPDSPHLFKYVAPHMAAALPSHVDLTPQCPPVYDQGELGSCTAHAAGALGEFIMMKAGHAGYVPSRLALYYWNRLQEGTVNSDSGASLQDAMNTLVKYGVPHEKFWPYVDQGKQFMVKPTKNVWTDGYWHSIKVGLSVTQDLNQIKTRLAQGYPIIFGFVVYESFESEQVAKTGIMSMPQNGEQEVGGHAVMAVGYDDKTKMIKVRNSWGSNWGQSGYFQMPYGYINDPNLASDFWTADTYIRFK